MYIEELVFYNGKVHLMCSYTTIQKNVGVSATEEMCERASKKGCRRECDGEVTLRVTKEMFKQVYW